LAQFMIGWEYMIYPTIRIAAAAQREGCPADLAPAVAAAVLRTAASEIAQRGTSLAALTQWASELEQDARPTGR